jgi:phenylpropionate dioxygenase-like ring-hydroxylating dioxygenase large terminal subunit
MSKPTLDPVLWNDWHPIAAASSIGRGAIVPAQLLDLPLALWRDSAGELHLWEDRCPHRGTRFSIGAVQGDSIRCAYHGWSFDGAGKCTHIPALPALGGDKLKARATTFAVRERDGLVWACLGEPPASLPSFPECGDARLRTVYCGPYEVRASAPRVVENFLDMAHFAFVHEGILGERGQAAIADYTVERFDDPVYGHGVWARQCSAWQPQPSRTAASGSQVEYSYRVMRPLSAILTKRTDGGMADAIGLHAQPLTETLTRAWIVMALADFDSSDEALRQFQDTIFRQDLPILENQLPQCLPLAPGAEVSVSCDRMSLAYRGYLKEQGLRYGVLHAGAE